ncbi:unnamed protein product [Absidia cylindrospora]
MTHRPVTMMRSVIKRRKRGSEKKKDHDTDHKKIKSAPTIKMVHTIPPLPAASTASTAPIVPIASPAAITTPTQHQPPQSKSPHHQQQHHHHHHHHQQQHQYQQHQFKKTMDNTKLPSLAKPLCAPFDSTTSVISTPTTLYASSSSASSTSSTSSVPSSPTITLYPHHHPSLHHVAPTTLPIQSSGGPCQHVHEQQEKRHYLQQEVNRLTQLLSETVAMLSSIDKVLQESPATSPCSQCKRPPQEQQVAQSLLSLAQSPPVTNNTTATSSVPVSSPPPTPSSSSSSSSPRTTAASNNDSNLHPHYNPSHQRSSSLQDYPKLPPIMMSNSAPSSSSLLPAIATLHPLPLK